VWQRVKPALLLILLTPLIAEYLSGSLSLAQAPLFPLMVLIYGMGALVVRETARRWRRGWPTILTLGVVYAVIEEGLATQSLFNPNYLGLRLLDRGFIPALGIGGPWTGYVIILHVVWSIAVPIGLVEAIFAERRTEPWLRGIGYAVSVALYVLGVLLVTGGTRSTEHFTASKGQLIATATIAVVLVVVALVLPQRLQGRAVEQRPPWRRLVVFGLLGFVVGSVFHLAAQLGGSHLLAIAAVAVELLLPIGVIIVVYLANRAGKWTDANVDAMVLGALLAHCWIGFLLTARLHGASTIPGQFLPLLLVLAVVYFGIVRQKMTTAAAL
jgi:hypothetical protein